MNHKSKIWNFNSNIKTSNLEHQQHWFIIQNSVATWKYYCKSNITQSILNIKRKRPVHQLTWDFTWLQYMCEGWNNASFPSYFITIFDISTSSVWCYNVETFLNFRLIIYTYITTNYAQWLWIWKQKIKDPMNTVCPQCEQQHPNTTLPAEFFLKITTPKTEQQCHYCFVLF